MIEQENGQVAASVEMEFDMDAADDALLQNVPEMFLKADQLLFKQGKFQQAESLYRKILEMEPDCIDALNSIAYCLKFEAASSDKSLDPALYDRVAELYDRALEIDGDDVEANFNIGSLYLQFNKENEAALAAFQKVISQNDGSEETELYRI